MSDETNGGVAFVDTETTGLDPDRCPVWEIAVIVPDGPHEGEHVWQQELTAWIRLSGWDDQCWWAFDGSDRGLPISDDGSLDHDRVDRWVIDNTGITKRYDHATALDERASIDRFCTLVDGRHLVGAVPSFDEERLRRQYRVCVDEMATRFPWHYHLIDVEALAVGYLSAHRRRIKDWSGVTIQSLAAAPPLPWSSDALSRALGVEPPGPDERHTALTDARWAKAIYEAVMGR